MLTSSPLTSSRNALLNPICHQTASGMTIIAEQMPIEAVNFSLWLPIGSALESDPLNGTAHFLEHMIFKGTPTLPPGKFEAEVEQCGGITNAMTSQDYTCFYVTTAPQDFGAIAPLQMDLVLNAAIAEDEFERERQVVLEEIRRSADNIRRRVFANTMELAFDHLPYRRPVLGPASNIENLAPAQMQQFHQQWYTPDHITAVVVGNLPVEEMIATIEQQLPPVHSGATPCKLPVFSPEESFQDIQRQDLETDRLTEARLSMVWRVPGAYTLEQTYALDALARILGSGRTSRLVQDLREIRGLVSHISVSNMTHSAQGLFWISAHLPYPHLKAVEDAILSHIQQLQEAEVTEAELDQIKKQTTNRGIFESETPSSRAGLYGYAHAVLGDLATGLRYSENIQALNPKTLQQAAQRFLSTTGYRTLAMYPPSH